MKSTIRTILLGIIILTSSFSFAQNKSEKQSLKENHNSISTSIQSSEKSEKPKTQEEFLLEKRDKYILWSNSEFRLKNNIPNDFPKYYETGDAKTDTNNFEYSLKQWITENRIRYNEIESVIKI